MTVTPAAVKELRDKTGAEVYEFYMDMRSFGKAYEEFYEPFSRTDSWMFRTIRVTIPKAGRYYLIAYAPSHENGKLWVAVGDKEQFSPLQIVRLPMWIRQIREFHEAKRS
jgi:hypothetical protein